MSNVMWRMVLIMAHKGTLPLPSPEECVPACRLLECLGADCFPDWSLPPPRPPLLFTISRLLPPQQEFFNSMEYKQTKVNKKNNTCNYKLQPTRWPESFTDPKWLWAKVDWISLLCQHLCVIWRDGKWRKNEPATDFGPREDVMINPSRMKKLLTVGQQRRRSGAVIDEWLLTQTNERHYVKSWPCQSTATRFTDETRLFQLPTQNPICDFFFFLSLFFSWLPLVVWWLSWPQNAACPIAVVHLETFLLRCAVPGNGWDVCVDIVKWQIVWCVLWHGDLSSQRARGEEQMQGPWCHLPLQMIARELSVTLSLFPHYVSSFIKGEFWQSLKSCTGA